MSIRLFLLTLLFPVCCVLLRAQTQPDAPVATEAIPANKCITKVENSYNTYTNYSSGHYTYSNDRNPCKVFIGVGTSPESGGLKVDYTMENTPARSYGVEVGDIILALDNVLVSSYSELTRERDKHQPGDAFTLNLLRDGRKLNVNARFKECSQEDLEQVRRKEENLRPILGVYENEESDQEQGLVIGEVISGKGAEAAGLQPGDVIATVDGKSVQGTGTLRTVLTGHKPGDPVTVIYRRDGQTRETRVTLSGDRNSFHYNVQRDPCAVFIGVYTSDAGLDEKGVKVTGVIEGTPAKQSEVQLGDVIVALDDQPINTYTELRRERDKHQPGDAFRMTVLRDGSMQTITATFKACLNAGKTSKPTQEVVATAPIKQPESNPETTLQVALDLFPNPTADMLTVRFEAEAIPTTVRIADASGKTVYSNVLNRFTGFFNEQISLIDQTPGIYTLTVQQGKKVISKNIVLVTRT